MLTRKLPFLILSVLLLATCSKEEPFSEISSSERLSVDPMSKTEINQFVTRQLIQHDRFDWAMGDSRLVWSAAVQSDSIVAVGYQPAGFENINERIHEVDIQSPAWRSAREKVLNFVLERTNELYPDINFTREDLLAFEADPVLPALDLYLFNERIIEELRSLPEVRYVDPMGYGAETALRSDSGCGVAPNPNIPTADYRTVRPNVRVSWHLDEMNVPNAWNTSTGLGITIAILDTGTSDDQENLRSAFNSGDSQGRNLTALGTYAGGWFSSRPDGPDDRCGHGTQMAGLATAPRGNDNNAVGAAYNANLLSIRVTSDVIINGSSEKRGVADGLRIAADRSDVKVISMSIGDVFSNGRVSDAVRYAHGKGKMILAAAGTSLSWTSWWGVIFPANMDETIAVTGVQDGLPLRKCNTCHDGSKVDFVCVMQRRSDNDRTALTLAESSDTPATVSGSSAATATTAGIAALVWATNPGQTKEQVLSRLQNASQFFPNRDGNFGWGLIDADAAVNGVQ